MQWALAYPNTYRYTVHRGISTQRVVGYRIDVGSDKHSRIGDCFFAFHLVVAV